MGKITGTFDLKKLSVIWTNFKRKLPRNVGTFEAKIYGGRIRSVGYILPYSLPFTLLRF